MPGAFATVVREIESSSNVFIIQLLCSDSPLNKVKFPFPMSIDFEGTVLVCVKGHRSKIYILYMYSIE
jgi:hypothetical protein